MKQTETAARLTVLVLFHERRPTGNIVANALDILKDLELIRVESVELPVFVSANKGISVSFSDSFVELRSCECDREHLQTVFVQRFLGPLVGKGIVVPRGVTLRLIDNLSVPEREISFDKLFREIGVSLGKHFAIEESEFETLSVKFYSHGSSGALYELDVGPNIRDTSKLYLELEARFQDGSSAESVNRLWNEASEVLRRREESTLRALAERAGEGR